MKKVLLALLLVSGAALAETPIDPTETGPVERGRFVSQDVSGYPRAIITDLKTGCQFMMFSGTAYTATPLGCFPDLISPKFKK